MIVLSFRDKKEADHAVLKAKKIEEYATDLVDCLEQAMKEEIEENYYQERGHSLYREDYPQMRGRYGYRRY